MSRRERPPGGRVSPGEALNQAAAALAEEYEPALRARDDERVLELRHRGGRLPDVTLRLQREQRLFSRTFPLWVLAEMEAPGPQSPGAVEYLRPKFLRKPKLRWVGPHGATAQPWVERLLDNGFVEGAMTMTNVQHLGVLWNAAEGAWRLQLSTLAGSLIGAGPVNSFAVPLEPDDVKGLLRLVEAFAGAVRSA